MPNTVIPSRVAALINSLTGAVCERMAKLFQFTSILHEDVSYYVNQAGLPTDEFKADLCEALSDCIGSGGDGGGGEEPNPDMAAPEALTASDDAYSDKIVIDWEPVADATKYKLYRSTTTSFADSALIATITAPTITYTDNVDSDLVAGTKYWYWARATDDTNTSALSNRDQGRAKAPGDLEVLDDISDLRATIGFGYSFIALVWTPPARATKYDIYRNTTATYAGATKIYGDVSPAATSLLIHPTNNPIFWDNEEEVVLYDTPPSATQDYYYWVVAKGDAPPSSSSESNSVLGRVNAPAIYNTTTIPLGKTESDMSYTVQAGETKMWAVLFGSGGGGAGGNATYGGGGGGGGGVVVEQFTVAEGDLIELILTPDQTDTGNAASASNGGAGALTELQLNGSTVISSTGGGGGLWNAAGGGGGGGAGGGASGGAPEAMYDGFSGKPGSGSAGGKSGFAFGQRRLPRVTLASPAYTGDGGVAHPGSGASSWPPNGLAAVGGKGGSGHAYLVFGT